MMKHYPAAAPPWLAGAVALAFPLPGAPTYAQNRTNTYENLQVLPNDISERGLNQAMLRNPHLPVPAAQGVQAGV